MKRSLQFFGAAVVGALILHAVLRQFDIRQVLVVLRQANLGLLMLGMALMVSAYAVRGARWRIWEKGLSYWDSLRLILIGFMGNNIVPARFGEILRAHCTAAKTRDHSSRTAALGSIVSERILDLFVLGVLSVVGTALIRIDHRFHWPLFVISSMLVALTSVLIFDNRCQESLRSLISATNGSFPGPVSEFVRQKANQFFEGLLSLRVLGVVRSAVVVTTIVWALEIGSYYLIGLSVWDQMNVGTALLLLVVVNFASLFPFTIGGVGTIEAAGLVFLGTVAVPPYPAVAMVLLQHACQYFFTTISGAIFYFTGAFYRARRSRTSVAPQNCTQGTTSSSILEETRNHLSDLSQSIQLRSVSSSTVQLSIVIPAYDEQARLPRTVLDTIRWCVNEKIDFELLIADDGSRDETLALAQLFEKSDARIRVLACPHMGKGSAVRIGMLNARGRYILFMDADGAAPLAESSKLLAAAKEGHDVVIGSRVRQGRDEVVVKTSTHRRIIGRVFAFFVNLFAIGGITDTQCGFKMFRREVAFAIFSRQKIVGFAFDVEILFLARKLGFSITEIPINWVAQAGSKVNIFTDSLRMLWDISRVRWLHRNLHSAQSFGTGSTMVKTTR